MLSPETQVVSHEDPKQAIGRIQPRLCLGIRFPSDLFPHEFRFHSQYNVVIDHEFKYVAKERYLNTMQFFHDTMITQVGCLVIFQSTSSHRVSCYVEPRTCEELQRILSHANAIYMLYQTRFYASLRVVAPTYQIELLSTTENTSRVQNETKHKTIASLSSLPISSATEATTFITKYEPWLEGQAKSAPSTTITTTITESPFSTSALVFNGIEECAPWLQHTISPEIMIHAPVQYVAPHTYFKQRYVLLKEFCRSFPSLLLDLIHYEFLGGTEEHEVDPWTTQMYEEYHEPPQSNFHDLFAQSSIVLGPPSLADKQSLLETPIFGFTDQTMFPWHLKTFGVDKKTSNFGSRKDQNSLLALMRHNMHVRPIFRTNVLHLDDEASCSLEERTRAIADFCYFAFDRREPYYHQSWKKEPQWVSSRIGSARQKQKEPASFFQHPLFLPSPSLPSSSSSSSFSKK